MRTHHTHKKLCIVVYLLRKIGPDYYVPRNSCQAPAQSSIMCPLVLEQTYHHRSRGRNNPTVSETVKSVRTVSVNESEEYLRTGTQNEILASC